jgi:dATP pyrophosphohydrolase
MTSVVCQVVEICLFRFSNNRPEYLLLKRSANDDLYPGIWQLITGSIRRGETALQAAFREFREETGLEEEFFWTVPCTISFFDQKNDVMHVSPLFAAQVKGDAVPSLSHEHAEFLWLPYEEAMNRLVWPGQRQGLDTVQRYIAGGEEASRLTLVEMGKTEQR